MAPKSDALDIFLLLAQRPHSQCSHFARRSLKSIRFASSSHLPPRPTEDRTVASKSGIPLHVGLDRNPEHLSAISRIPIPKGERGEKFTPSVLARPLGLQKPPRAGENSPVDKRTAEQRKLDLQNPEKSLEQRRVLLRSYFRPYFQEWKRADHYRGKTFQSNPRLFKREKALYFPNIWGATLSKEGDGPDGGRNLAPALFGKISIISMQAGHWAQEQVDTFIGPKSNPDLERLVARYGPKVQRIDVNMQPDWIRALLVKLFRNSLRKTISKERWDKYFMIKLPRDVRRGLTEDVRDAMGLLNSQIGYVYLVDSSAKIRWAGSGDAWEGEVGGLNSAIERLVEEERAMISPKKPLTSSQPPRRKEGVQTPLKAEAVVA
ncbi:uncharacterized protein HMPREF1541_00338 [Cyphellophora europaea CBS 101466]|uniref:Mitochondrial ATPase complex subunit ATP10 n=1 Tax=Cyphellophora europaea (strain CBS 101466) TaxID=1220924 RepID=W2SE14_CYPE1|nr:uncharacterized protein HMPREF1541_00338 [Cyphellophora europaea CBS 101466]ETN46154.1 hypothetical protein HMPREF1541_00338 [Cyphellophora europaea CBS 101466]